MVEMMVSVNNGQFKTQVLVEGDGEPLVFLHGAGGQAQFDPFLQHLAERFRVYVPIHPGYGKSEGVEQLDDIHDLVFYYLQLFDEMGWEDPIVVGHSMGAMFAAEIAAIAPERVSRLVLVSPVGLWDDANPIPDFFAMLPEELAPILFHDPEGPIAKAMFAVPEDESKMVDAMVTNIQNLSVAGRFLWPIPDKGLKKRIQRISSPTLLVWGASDGLALPSYAKMFLDRISGARLVMLDASGHVPQYEQEPEFTAALMDFLDE